MDQVPEGDAARSWLYGVAWRQLANRHRKVRRVRSLKDRMARAMNTSIFTKNAPTYSGLGLGGEGYSSFTIASPTGEGLTHAQHFSRRRRCTLKEYFRIV